MLTINYEELVAKAKDGEISTLDAIKVGVSAGLKGSLDPLGGLADLAKVLSGLGGLTADDAENVSRIIKAGREEGVDEMEIEMDRESWLGLKGKFAGNENVEVGFGTGGSTGYKLKVKYK